MRRALPWIVVAGCATPHPPAPRGPIAVPDACRVRPPDDGQAPWHWSAGIECQAARAADGGLVVLDWPGHMLRRTNPDGSPRWAVDYRDADGTVCGAPNGVAIAADGSVAVACGYSLLAFDPDGGRRWQIWPARDNHVGGPAVDGDGVIYVTAGGALHAIAPDGKERWATGYGGGRSASAIGVTAAGDFVVESTEDVWFGDDDIVYHPDPDPQLTFIRRDGTLIEQRPRGRDEPWPAWVPIVDDGGGRLPPLPPR